MVVPQKTKVLVVDDEPQIREIISEHFEIFGFEVTQAPNGREAPFCNLNHFKSSSPISICQMEMASSCFET